MRSPGKWSLLNCCCDKLEWIDDFKLEWQGKAVTGCCVHHKIKIFIKIFWLRVQLVKKIILIKSFTGFFGVFFRIFDSWWCLMQNKFLLVSAQILVLVMLLWYDWGMSLHPKSCALYCSSCSDVKAKGRQVIISIILWWWTEISILSKKDPWTVR